MFGWSYAAMMAIVPAPPVKGRPYAFFTSAGNNPAGPSVVFASTCIGGRAVNVSREGIMLARALKSLIKKPEPTITKTTAQNARPMSFFIFLYCFNY